VVAVSLLLAVVVGVACAVHDRVVTLDFEVVAVAVAAVGEVEQNCS
jgi:hypothetical protein